MTLDRPIRVHGQSVRTRLLIWNVGVVALVLALLGVVIQYTIQSVLETSVDNDLRKSATTFMGQAKELLARGQPPPDGRGGPHGDGEHRDGPGFDHGGFGGPPPGPPPGGRPRFSQPSRMTDDQRRQSYIPRVFDMSGEAQRPFQNVGAWDADSVKSALKNETVRATVTIDGEPVRVLTVPIISRQSVVGAVQAAHPVADIRQAILSVNQTLFALIPVGLICAGLAGAMVTSRALKPVARIAQTANNIRAEDLRARLDVVGEDEFSHLATTINRMLGRLEGSFEHQKALVHQLETLLEDQKRFTADASHELKTPLSVAKVHCGLLLNSKPTDQEYKESVESIGESIDRMGCLVQDLLLLAHADAGQLGKRKTSLILQDLLSRARQHQNAVAGASIQIENCESCGTVLGSEDELVRVFDNLLANARRHTPIDGAIRVTCHRTGDRIIVRIADTGEGIAPEHIPHLGERFYRIDSARSRGHGGVGLGLSICKSLLESNQGSLHFESEPGAGTTATVTLPAEPL